MTGEPSPLQVPAEIQEKPCVDPEELKEIVRVAKHVEEHFQTPQDMEWVLDRFQPFRKAFIGSRPDRPNTPRSKKRNPNIWRS